MPQKGIRDFCQVALEKNLTSPERIKEVLADCIRAQKSGREASVGEIFLRREYLTRKQVFEIMRELYGESSVPENGGDLEGEGDSREDTAPKAVERGHAEQVAEAALAAADLEEEYENGSKHRHGKKITRRRADRAVSMPWYLLLGLPVVIVLGILAGRLAEGLLFENPRAPAAPAAHGEPSVDVVLATELEEGMRIEGTRWADVDGRGTRALLIHYSFGAEGQRSDLPKVVTVLGVYDRAIVETRSVTVEMEAERVLAIGKAVGNGRLFGGSGVLRDQPSGVLVVPFEFPALIEKVILVPGE